MGRAHPIRQRLRPDLILRRLQDPQRHHPRHLHDRQPRHPARHRAVPRLPCRKIRSVRTIPLNEEIRVHTNPAPSLPVVEAPAAGVAPQSPCSAPAPSPADVASGQSPCSAPEQASSVAAQRQFRAEGVPVPEIPSPEAPSAALSPEPEVMASGSIPAASESASAPHVMEFACLPDAREYLKKEFGYEEREVRTTAQAKSAARSHGLEIIIA